MQFDLIIAYSNHYIKNSFSNNIDTHPFIKKYANYSDSYAYFLNYCKTKKLACAFATSNDIIGPGKFKNYWVYKKKKWYRILQEARSSFIFDKFTPTTKEDLSLKELLYSDPKIKPFNSNELSELFKNKLNTYNILTQDSIPTVQILKPSKVSIQKSLNQLQKLKQQHPKSNDFSEEVVLKDQFGLGGNNVFKIGSNYVERIFTVLKKHSQESFIIQPFVKYQNSKLIKGFSGFVDIRVIILNTKVIQSYIRIAKKGDFRCNTHQGGTFVFIKNIPKDVLKISNKLINKIYPKISFYALDFIKSDAGNIYLVEGNNNPGLAWDRSNKANDNKTKLLIHKVVRSIAERITK